MLELCLSDEIIPDLNNIVRDIEDEGDRCYFGSTNDADRLREIADWLEANFRRTPPASQSDEALRREIISTLMDADFDPPWAAVADAILPILHRVRREGIEEAAKVVENMPTDYGTETDVVEATAAAIRALAEKQP